MDILSQEDQAFYNKLLSSFKIESQEHVKQLADGLLKIEKGMEGEEFDNQLHSMFRAAHSLKGASRAVNIVCIEAICQSIENVFSVLKKNKTRPSSALISTLYESIDILEDLIRADKESLSIEPKHHAALLEKLETHVKNNDQSNLKGEGVSNIHQNLELKDPALKDGLSPNLIANEITDVVENTHHSKEKYHAEANQTIRTSLTKIDILLQHVEEMLMIKLSSQQKVDSLKNLKRLLFQGEKQFRALDAEKIILSFCKEGTPNENILSQEGTTDGKNLANQLSFYFDSQKQFFKELRDSLNKVSRFCEQDHRSICGMVDSVLDDTKDILMLPFSTILESFPRMMRDLSKILGKEVLLTMTGVEIEIDKRILEQLKDPLIHILRNSIDHGIELPEERKVNKKQIQGNIKISAHQVSGNLVRIAIEDDGRGINIDKIKKVAIQNGLLSETEAKEFSEKEALALIFRTGFSTSSNVTELSGRGIGMTILAENIERLGGKISVDTKINEGTTIQILLPLTLATFRGIHLEISGQDYIIPTHNVCRVLRISENQIKTIGNQQMLSYEEKNHPYIYLRDILNLPTLTKNEKNDVIILMVKASEKLVAIGIDKIISEEEVFVKSLGSQLKRVPYISCATVTEWGKVIPVLDPFDLVKSILKNTFSKVKNIPQKKQIETFVRTVLVAEDSATTRMLLKNILESAGYNVRSAVDGIEAFAILAKEKIDLLLTDVEMPKMDGIELTAKIRSSENLKNLPVVLCTSRGSKEDRERGIEVGANAYLDKSGFVQSNLLEVLGQLL